MKCKARLDRERGVIILDTPGGAAVLYYHGEYSRFDEMTGKKGGK